MGAASGPVWALEQCSGGRKLLIRQICKQERDSHYFELCIVAVVVLEGDVACFTVFIFFL